MSDADAKIQIALEAFCQAVSKKFAAGAKGEPEDQLRAPFETLLQHIGLIIGWDVIAKGESLLEEGLGKPDYAIVVKDALCGYAELKAPGVGVIPSRLKGHDKSQFNRFKALPNILYCDGNDMALYQEGRRVDDVVTITEDTESGEHGSITKSTARKVHALLLEFLSWEPIVPTTAKQLAEVLAPICRLVRDATSEVVENKASALAHLKADWQALLFPEADNDQFADAYAQTVTYSLLLARAEGASKLDSAAAINALGASEHLLLSRALQVLTDTTVRQEIGSLLSLLERTIAAVAPETLTMSGEKDPWLYFYETFLAAYDPALRRNAGVYYTPVAVVQAQVRLADQLLRTRLGKPQGFAEPDVLTLDPALGTGTYLIAVIQHALDAITATQGPGARPAKATSLGRSLHGFEMMVGPYAVAQLRVTRELKDNSANLPPEGAQIYLTDTLEHPTADAPAPPLFLEPIAIEHARAQQVKDKAPILVCLGNPPYDRHDADADLGAWIRHGGEGEEPLLQDFIEPVRKAGRGVDLKNLYNLYVYFWRWALWKVFEHGTPGPGIVSYISASSYLSGPAFLGMREKMREECDEIWIIDLGGEGRGTRKEENIFSIQTPVAIAIAIRSGLPMRKVPASVNYARLRGDRAEKLAALEAINALQDLEWEGCPTDWQAPFRPEGVGDYFRWPALSDLLPWQHSGVEVKRLWPIGPDKQTLTRRWHQFFSEVDGRGAFRETADRKIDRTYPVQPWIGSGPRLSLLREEVQAGKEVPEVPRITRYAYRAFDREFLLADYRLIDRGRPPIWSTASDKQIYLTTLLTHPLGAGPAVVIAADPPDRHCFRGSFGGKDTLPLWRDSDATEPNLHPELLDLLTETMGRVILPDDFLAYLVALLAHHGYTELFDAELETPGIHVPITKSADLFEQAMTLGKDIVWRATYGERFGGTDRKPGEVKAGVARNTHPVSQLADEYPSEYFYEEATKELRVGSGVFAPVDPEVWNYQVSGLRVVASWLDNRMLERSGKTRSSLDRIQPDRWTSEMNEQLLELLWTLEGLIQREPEQLALLQQIVAGELFTASELSALLDDSPARQAPSVGQETLL